MSLKYVDDMKKNRFSIFYNYFNFGTNVIKFDEHDGQSVYRGGLIVTIGWIDNAQYADMGVVRYINSFEMSAGVLQNTANYEEVYGNGDGALSISLINADDDLAIQITNDGDMKDLRVDIEFFLPDDDYMIYTGTG